MVTSDVDTLLVPAVRLPRIVAATLLTPVALKVLVEAIVNASAADSEVPSVFVAEIL